MMLTVEKAAGGDRDEMETWFQRAMEADGDNQAACDAKMDWLDPKWHGSVEEMLEFGRACRDTKNWRAGLTLLLPDAHHRAVLVPAPRSVKFQYFAAPAVWDDVRSAYDEYLGHYPKDYVERSQYAVLCYLCGKHDESHRQFVAVGDNLVWSLAYPERIVKGPGNTSPTPRRPRRTTAERALRKAAPGGRGRSS